MIRGCYGRPSRASGANTARRRTPRCCARLRQQIDDAMVELTGLIVFRKISSKLNSALGGRTSKFWACPRGRKIRTDRGAP